MVFWKSTFCRFIYLWLVSHVWRTEMPQMSRNHFSRKDSTRTPWQHSRKGSYRPLVCILLSNIRLLSLALKLFPARFPAYFPLHTTTTFTQNTSYKLNTCRNSNNSSSLFLPGCLSRLLRFESVHSLSAPSSIHKQAYTACHHQHNNGQYPQV